MRTASQPTLSQQLRQKNGAAEECAAKAEVPRQREIPGTEAAKTLQRPSVAKMAGEGRA